MNKKTSSTEVTYLDNYRPPDFYIHKTNLSIDITEERVKVYSILSIGRNSSNQSEKKNLKLFGQELSLQKVILNGSNLSVDKYAVDDESLTIFSVPDEFILEIEVIIFPKKNTSLEGLYKSRTIYCTQCEAEGFRRITYYLDRPDVMSEFTTTIYADKLICPVLLSNGNLIDSGDCPNSSDKTDKYSDDERHWATWHDPFPKPCYLFAMVAGNLTVIKDNFFTYSGKQIDIRLFVEPKDIDKCRHAIDSLKNAMQWDEKVYGREYDLSLYMIVAVDDFNMGAMENKGLNIFNTSCVLAHPNITTDAGYKRVEGVVAHEYFHNWSGNRVTCRDWFQLSLKEGFTVYRDSEFSADMGSSAVKRIEDVNFLRSIQFSEDSGPTAHPVQPKSYLEISNFYTVTIYEKGAEIVRMINTLIGPELFRKGSDLYFSKYDGQAATIDDFISTMAEVSGRSLKQFMLWYKKSGTPLLNVSGDYDEINHSYKLTFEQVPAKTINKSITPITKDAFEYFHIPVKVGLISNKGAVPLNSNNDDSVLIELTKKKETFTFNNIDKCPVPSLLQDFSAPVRLDFPYSEDDLVLLIIHDPDGFSSWNACQQLAVSTMKKMQLEYITRKKLALKPHLYEAFFAVINRSFKDKAMQALLLTLPSEQIMAEISKEIDVDAIHMVRTFILSELGTKLNSYWVKIYESNLTSKKYTFNAAEVARRSIKNLALGYLVAAESKDSLDLVVNQIIRSNNMTDRLAALNILVNDTRNASIGLTQKYLDEFYQEYKDEPLVLNQWFQMQATCSLPGGLNRVKKLMKHPAFDLSNPNKVRSLIGVFCNNNPTNFHSDEGGGYKFLVDQISTLDKLNPQIAARLVAPLTKWRKFPKTRGNRMREELNRLVSIDNLSRDTYEIVSKSLN
ncbi:MAG: aminopeptidase N [Porticoccus sp.]|jgi:aminopeptidase N|nr:aminopeptidase N [Porticoccus sp.]